MEKVEKQNLNYEGLSKKVISSALKMPLVRVDRQQYLRQELAKYYSAEVVECAIETNPQSAGVSDEIIAKIAKTTINKEVNAASVVSAGLGLPGGWAMAGTIPVDLAQFYGVVINGMQKLMYLYGWSDLTLTEENMDDETYNTVLIMLGVMSGNAAAANLIKKSALAASSHVQKVIMKTAVSKTAWYPMLKEIGKWVGINITKQTTAKGAAKFVPVLGAGMSFGATQLIMRGMFQKLKKQLEASNAVILESPNEQEIDIDTIVF